MDAEREERREEGGAYCEEGRGGYGSMIRTSWTEEVPKPEGWELARLSVRFKE